MRVRPRFRLWVIRGGLRSRVRSRLCFLFRSAVRLRFHFPCRLRVRMRPRFRLLFRVHMYL